MFIIFIQTEVRITDADLHPMFVQVALLQKGDSFVRTKLDVSLSIMSDISRVKPRSNVRNMPTQHIATLLGATCCVRLPPCCDVLRQIGCCWLKFDHFQI